jgi:hypothetical protein
MTNETAMAGGVVQDEIGSLATWTFQYVKRGGAHLLALSSRVFLAVSRPAIAGSAFRGSGLRRFLTQVAAGVRRSSIVRQNAPNRLRSARKIDSLGIDCCSSSHHPTYTLFINCITMEIPMRSIPRFEGAA